MASVQRMTLICKAFIYAGIKTTIIIRKGSWKQDQYKNFKYQGNFEGIDYIYTSKNVHKPIGFVARNFQKLKGIYGEYKHVQYLKKYDGLSMAIVSNRNVVHILRYKFYAWFLGFPLVINLVEKASSMEHKESIIKKANNYLIDKWTMGFFDGALPISNDLMNFYNTVSSTNPRMKVPIICDFEKFKQARDTDVEPYFLYCGSFHYVEVRNFVVKAFNGISENENINLYMIVSGGSKKETKQLQNDVNKVFKTDRVKLFSDIPYEQLVQLYINALALLIPLRNTVQDASRFPHKIGEYLASGNVVITTAVGEIKNYFEDEKTALIAENYDVDNFTEKMKYVLQNPEKAKKIGLKGKEMGLKEFNYKSQAPRLKSYLEKLSER